MSSDSNGSDLSTLQFGSDPLSPCFTKLLGGFQPFNSFWGGGGDWLTQRVTHDTISANIVTTWSIGFSL